MQILKKNLAGGLKINKILLFYILLLITKNLYSAQIYDYQTEEFIKGINSQILSVNKYDKQIKFKIINDNFPNAFVTEDNTIFLSSGLLVHSPDYVSLLAVLAHEIGHIEKYHISKRKNEIKNIKKISILGNVAAIAGSMIIQEPELINTIIFNQTATSNLYMNFSQEQEKEADLYAVETLNSLGLSTNSIKKFLLLLEDKTNFDLLDDELKKFSTHPLFQERYDIINYNKISNSEVFNLDLQNNFGFIKAKFMAYTNNGFPNKLNKNNKAYYDVIKYSLSGDLLLSLKKLNFLILKYDKNSFLQETKADILLSYGYNKEALKFYQKVLDEHPNNNYVKFNIFMNTNIVKQDKNNLKKTFLNFQNLIQFFPNNKIFIKKYYNLSNILQEKDWIEFFEILLYKKNNIKIKLNNLYDKTTDNNLKNILKLYT